MRRGFDGPNRPAVQDFGVATALVVLVVPNIMGWISLTKLTGGGQRSGPIAHLPSEI